MTRILLCFALCAVACAAIDAAPAPADRLAYVDDEGVMRWQDDDSEIALFGVNYYPPFSIDYQLIKGRGLDHKEAIRQDVEHFARLGLTAIRLHCWDREMSDHDGNLLDNEHLELLDYLIAQCKDNGIYSVMTPMAWWGSPTGGGFSDLYTMDQMTSDPEVWKIQCNYLKQYVNHVNRYTDLAYKDDPAIVCFEFINEPIYPPDTTDEQIVDYVNTMYDAVRSTGCQKPLFHSFFAGRQAAVGKSKAEGLTFGWYPTGLVAGMTLTGNHLSSVNDYPSMRDENVKGKAKIVYEFDAADVHAPYMYPAMARAFRSGGCQSATQFQYDPMCLADGNQNWQTHYLNLCYTPNKAISFAIAAEVFRRTPRLARFDNYPEGGRFGDFRVSYEEKLSEMVTEDTFMYANDTSTQPPAPGKLTRVWGCGSSPVVRYAGKGAYFLDKDRDGWWRLEVYPDAVLVDDPYRGGTNEKTRILWSEHEMQISLPDLGDTFDACSMSDPGVYAKAVDGKVSLGPGRYVISRDGGRLMFKRAIPLTAPPSSDAPPAINVTAPSNWREGYPLTLGASVAATDVEQCLLEYRQDAADSFQSMPMELAAAYSYAATIPQDEVKPGAIEYRVRAQTGRGTYLFPGGKLTSEVTEPGPRPPLAVMAVEPGSEVPANTYSGPEGKWARASIVPGSQDGVSAIRLESNGFGEPPSCAGIRWAAEKLPDDLSDYDAVTFVIRGGPYTSLAEIVLVQEDGSGFGYNVPLGETWGEVTVPAGKLKAMWATTASTPDFSKVKQVSVIFGAWLFDDVRDRDHWVEVESVSLTQKSETWAVQVAPKDGPVLLVEPAERSARTTGVRSALRTVPGMDRGKQALRISVGGFGPEPSCSAMRVPVDEGAKLWTALSGANTLVVKARAGTPDSDKVEIVLIEEDGAPWGMMEVPLTQKWEEIKIPLDELRYFAHWNPTCVDRGGENDRVRPDKVSRVSFCFGAFLYPETYEQPHVIEIQEVSLARE